MILLPILGCGLLISLALFSSPPGMQLILSILFLAASVAGCYRFFAAYLIFTFLYPLLPSELFEVQFFDYLEFVFLSFALGWAIQRARQKQLKLPENRLNRLLGLFLLVVLVSCFLALLREHYIFSEIFLSRLKENWNIFVPQNSESNLEPLRMLIRIAEGILFFFITVDAAKAPEKTARIARVAFYASGFVSFLGILQYIFRFRLLHFWIEENPNIVRIHSTFTDPNSLGTYLAAMFCFGLFSYGYAFPNAKKGNVAVLLIQLVALVLTGSRSALGSVFLTVLLLPVVCRIWRFDPWQKINKVFRFLFRYGIYICLFVIGTIVLISAVVNYRNPHPESMIQVALYSFNPRIPLNEVLKGRFDLWGAAIRMFADSPVFGNGPGTFGHRLLQAPFFMPFPENAHNYFLQILAEGGLLLFVAFLAIVYQLAKSLNLRSASDSEPHFYQTLGLLAALSAFLLTSLTGHPLLLLKLQLVFWGAAALLTGSSPAKTGKRFYQVVYTVVLIAGIVQGMIHLDSRNLAVYEKGYYFWEKDETNTACRWTGKEGVSILQVRDKVLEFQLRQLNSELLTKPYLVSVYINDRLLDRAALADTNWKLLRYYLPGVNERDVIELKIIPESTFIPAKLGDARDLGVQVSRFSWDCFRKGGSIGVYDLERSEDRAFFWTSGQASFALDNPSSKISITLLPNESVSQSPVEAELFWNDRPMKTVVLEQLQWTKVELEIPPSEPTGVLTLRVSNTINPARIGLSSDTRQLGVRVALPFEFQATDQQPAARPMEIRPSFYAFVNVGNWPFRVYKTAIPGISKNFMLLHHGRLVPERNGWISAIGSPNPWTPIFRIEKDIVEGAVLAGAKHWPVSLQTGFYLLRIKAKGSLEGGGFPIARITLDDREVARQPIYSTQWEDYFLYLNVKFPAKDLGIELTNDLFDPKYNIDRNIFIEEIAIAKRDQELRFKSAGFEISGDQFVVAEPVNSTDYLAPESRCYILRENSQQ